MAIRKTAQETQYICFLRLLPGLSADKEISQSASQEEGTTCQTNRLGCHPHSNSRISLSNQPRVKYHFSDRAYKLVFHFQVLVRALLLLSGGQVGVRKFPYLSAIVR